MCNLYSITTNQEAIRRFARATVDRTGNLPRLPGVFPDQMAPVVGRDASGNRVLDLLRWGLPGPKATGEAPVTNVRNTASPHWRRWLGVSHRCLVPANSFCEYEDTKPRKTPTWFALDEERPLFAFAGLWTQWTGTRGPKSDPVEGRHRLFAFLTTDANAEVKPVHPKAMPVILTEPEQMDLWLEGDWEEAKALQRPLPDGTLKIVARGERKDEGTGGEDGS